MCGSTDTETPNFAKDLRDIRILIFKSHGRALLYSGRQRKKFNNWALATAFAEANEMVPIQTTEGGQHLSTPDRKFDLKYSNNEFIRVWDRASVKYCLNIEGPVKTFVCGANAESTFRRKEIRAMLFSATITEINGRPHEDYVRLRRSALDHMDKENNLSKPERHRRAINKVFRAIAIAEIRQDLAIAREQNNAPEEQSVLARIFHVKAQHREELRRMPLSSAQRKISGTMHALEEMSHANPNLHIPLFMPRQAHG